MIAVRSLTLLLAAGAVLVAACGATPDPPPRNPLDTSGQTGPAAIASPPSAATGGPTATAPAGGTPAAPADGRDEVDLEVATGAAIDALAEWLGVPAASLSVAGARTVAWPDSCLGVRVPGIVCAQVVTAGVEVLLLDPLDGTHGVHADAAGRLLWRGETVAAGTTVEVDAAAGRLVVLVDGDALTLRIAPGTRWPGAMAGGGGLGALAAGDAVTVAYDDAPDGRDPPVIAWLAPAP